MLNILTISLQVNSVLATKAHSFKLLGPLCTKFIANLSTLYVIQHLLTNNQYWHITSQIEVRRVLLCECMLIVRFCEKIIILYTSS